MKNPSSSRPPAAIRALVATIAASAFPLGAAEFVYEPFDAPAGTTLTGLAGGSGWSGAWFQEGGSGTIRTPGLAYTDSLGNMLLTQGQAMTTAGTETTRSFRTVAGGPLNDVWISFLYNLPLTNSNFEGVTFYRNNPPNPRTEVLSVSNNAGDTSAGIRLAYGTAGGPTVPGEFGKTHFIVLKLSAGAGPGGIDRAEMFVDPLLIGTPTQTGQSVTGANMNFDTVRLAAQNGATLLVDEFRIGHTFADVTPHIPASEDQDSDGDGLTDIQEAILGLDPHHDDSELIQNIRDNPDMVGLFRAEAVPVFGGVVVPRPAEGPASITFEIQRSGDLVDWPETETLNRTLELPAGKNFLRLTVERP